MLLDGAVFLVGVVLLVRGVQAGVAAVMYFVLRFGLALLSAALERRSRRAYAR